jgi:DNA-binding XRE family transcriptional regulator
MTPAEIKRELKVKHKDLAEIIGCSSTAITLVIQKKSVSQRIMKGIAAALQKPVHEVFPEHFNE